MKKSFLSIALCATSCLASQPDKDDTVGNWTETYHFSNGSYIRHTPYDLEMDGVITPVGIRLKAPVSDSVFKPEELFLKPKMSRKEFEEILLKATGAEKIKK